MKKTKYLALLFFIVVNNYTFSQSFFSNKKNVTGFTNIKNNNGVSVADYDNDNDLDIFIVSKGTQDNNNPENQNKLFRNNNDGTFTDVTEQSNLANSFNFDNLDLNSNPFYGLEGLKYGAFWGDYNNDDYPDLFLTSLSKVKLFKNNQDGTFSDVTGSSGILETNNCGNTGATWLDFNNDGFLDLFINDWNYCKTNTLYKNNKDGTFSNITEQTSIKNLTSKESYVGFPFDFNDDNLIDIYISNDLLQPNELLVNTGNEDFIEQATDFNINTKANDMSISIGDPNNDGFFDFFITAIDQNFFLVNNGNNTYSDKSSENSIENTGWSWGSKLSDFDNDGDEDLIVVSGFNGRGPEKNVYLENKINEDLKFSDETSKLSQELGISVEVIDFDYDNDGDLDVFITNSDSNSLFYENTTIEPNNNSSNWLQVKLKGTLSNRNGIGTILSITTENRTIKRYHSGVGFLGQSLKPVHFGIKNDDSIKELKIEWPSGEVDIYNDLSINSFYEAIEKSGIEKLNILPSTKKKGCTNIDSCNYDPEAITDDNSCVFLNAENILGNKNVNYLSEETYTYPLKSDETISWNIEGGEVINITPNSVTIKWNVESEALIKAQISNSTCKSEIFELKINVSLTNNGQNNFSIARIWNEALLNAIRNDYARPTVHARNLFHFGIALYDSWAIYNLEAKTYLIGNNLNNFKDNFSNFTPKESIEISREKTISYAAYKLLSHRFKSSPGFESSQEQFDQIMHDLGYDINYKNIDYENGNGAALGNYIAEKIIEYGLKDGSREAYGYDNAHYQPINQSLSPNLKGNPTIEHPNYWQPLSLNTFIDQSGNLITSPSIDFLSPEWGKVHPFSLNEENITRDSKQGHDYIIYNNPIAPPYIGDNNTELDEAYKWGFSLVSIWGAHLSTQDGVLWDISPNKIGNISSEDFPKKHEQYPDFYNKIEGGDIGKGYEINPITGEKYETQIVPRGDYARVLAEFWADGPDSETPPGHWFTILNYVSDKLGNQKKLEGIGEKLTDLEWDVKSYFTLGGTMHDAAISAWSIKGWYDYIRPISAIRYMADKGQSTDATLPNYSPHGIPLVENYIEVVKENDPLAGRNKENVNKIKLYTWRGHSYIADTSTDSAEVGWILAENWWPYQRPSFVTPPFAGYVSGHSTFSRAAAEVLTLLTGSPFFPDGLGEFTAKKDEFLVFENGPSVDIKLQWATYRDASDQCSLSRIWGGIHPPADDIPGRLIGEQIGINSFTFSKSFFSGKENPNIVLNKSIVYPNPLVKDNSIFINNSNKGDEFTLYNTIGKKIPIRKKFYPSEFKTEINITDPNVNNGVYFLKSQEKTWKILFVK